MIFHLDVRWPKRTTSSPLASATSADSAAGPVPDVRIAPLVESDRRDQGQRLPIANAAADMVGFGEVGVEDPGLRGRFRGERGGADANLREHFQICIIY